MPAYDFTAPRLFVEADLRAGARLPLDRAQANYLLNVLRRKPEDPVLLFNGRDGEWRASLAPSGRKSADLDVAERVRAQTARADLHYLFAPLKSARLDYLAQKAVELGAGTIRPVFTRYTQGERINLDRLRANAIEAAEQCGILAIPDLAEAVRLPDALDALSPERLLVFCDEDAPVSDPVAALRGAADPAAPPPLAVLVGPEGGFSEEERARIRERPNTVALSLGPRILRADTAAVAVLALVQAVLGDAR
ncbi:16S rRNA (uracil(1498)-N(3))-methyltransferase [Methylobacterium dankookense]|uniref:Ribosomal RNA small subunit methyltransferase E n=1 Tax=Methylobacterium dankookense TaxID=560405 RepID=A0A564FY55_9HYPH|nr:16S rRNA (uracil(1498)-N(3))-methyltransferase [Methylobacterium dankookense]GJD57376.1 Ribosomal RNA small subunit methyltransferase E [Methylobacterium dankookense]VUF12668.1 Ribosomal RNA small subunit methyltransferase E [Methylobacterium dankookense]